MGTSLTAPLLLLFVRNKVRSSQAPCTSRRCCSACRLSLLFAYIWTPDMIRRTLAL